MPLCTKILQLRSQRGLIIMAIHCYCVGGSSLLFVTWRTPYAIFSFNDLSSDTYTNIIWNESSVHKSDSWHFEGKKRPAGAHRLAKITWQHHNQVDKQRPCCGSSSLCRETRVMLNSRYVIVRCIVAWINLIVSFICLLQWKMTAAPSKWCEPQVRNCKHWVLLPFNCVKYSPSFILNIKPW